MDTITYIENGINQISTLRMLEKFDFLLSSVNVVAQKKIKKNELIKRLITNMEALRFEIAYNKSSEAIGTRLDKILAYEILKLSRLVFNGKDLVKAINNVLYYEINEGFKAELINERNSYQAAADTSL